MMRDDTICALSTPNAPGAIGVIRLSGDKAIEIANSVFEGKDLSKQKGQTLHFGKIKKGDEIIDEVMLSLFRGPHSYTGEDVIEISCHGSPFILAQVIELMLEGGASAAREGEFSMRAYLNGKMDLAQAEAVADLIAAESKAAHQMAMHQMRGGFSEKIRILREELIHFASMIELELDFGEEDVTFAERDDLDELVKKILKMIRQLIDSFADGRVIKEGIPVAIVGEPNVGKSTLLNALLQEDKAIVSEIAGTTRDSIEDVMRIGGMLFRFIDTAGIRQTEDVVESIGIKRSYEMMKKASLILLLVDAREIGKEGIKELEEQIKAELGANFAEKELITIVNKKDLIPASSLKSEKPEAGSQKPDFKHQMIYISALKEDGIEELQTYLEKIAIEKSQHATESIVSNARHHQALKKAAEALERVEEGIANGLTGDFLAMDIRQAQFFLGEIIGTIDIDRDILGHIFSSFCIGK
ncbi:MAG: tRNA uridine-5-carboxymethylaminomethyl(34) synthesis GTPase MnmE [Flavobacteriales bacterium]|nr:tRNA uridine-5-carboxymethylaminomethyl(34) synthesis GTPase MnmE [Flavobacteriales bacterium]